MNTICKTKPQSHSRKGAKSRIECVRELCITLEISSEEWLSLFFETGCQVAEILAGEMALEYTTNERIGYWDWYLNEYVHDDEELMRIGVKDKGLYFKLKNEIPIRVYESKA